jgi:apolipoprotein N-acyltransferase
MTGWRLPLALVSGLLLALAFPRFSLPDAAWAALVPLLVALVGARPGYGFLLGFLQGAVFYGITLSWLFGFLRGYGGLAPIVAAAVLGLMVAALSLFTAAFGLGVAFLSRRSLRLALGCAPFLWVALELARTDLPVLGFPWNLTGYAAAAHLGPLQFASLAGVYGLSFLVVGYNALLAWAVEERAPSSLALWSLATLALALGIAFGGQAVPRAVPDRVAYLVQANLTPRISYPADWFETHQPQLDQLVALSSGPGCSRAGPIVWPEVPAPFSLADPQFVALARRIARCSADGFLVGVDDWKPLPGGRMGISNAAVLLDPSGRPVFTYDKIHLVPFGEYVPWRRWLFFAKKLTGGLGDFTPGQTIRVGKLPGGRFGVFICYEAVFSGEVRRFVAQGAELLFNISDDGWYGHSAALAQHMEMARVRAVENRRWLLRDTNTGLTVDVDPYGRIVAQLAPSVRAVLPAPYAFRSDRTLFARWGNWFAGLSVGVAAGMLLAGGIVAVSERKREKKQRKKK